MILIRTIFEDYKKSSENGKEGRKEKKKERDGRMGKTLAFSKLNPWEYCFKVYLFS